MNALSQSYLQTDDFKFKLGNLYRLNLIGKDTAYRRVFPLTTKNEISLLYKEGFSILDGETLMVVDFFTSESNIPIFLCHGKRVYVDFQARRNLLFEISTEDKEL
jgi:hypothetical protein